MCLRLAEELGLPVVVSSALETSVGIGAGVALAAALPELPFACGLGTAALLSRDVVDDPLVPVGGVLGTAAGRIRPRWRWPVPTRSRPAGGGTGPAGKASLNR